ncbi:MAG: DUF3089 domain-containing protein [Ruminiclostridium sp.]|nr:DUF3089 domain-containing protein [Ruminiclostridium sp.]
MLMLSVPVCAESANEITQTADSTDYSEQDNWVFWDYGEDRDADLFIVCPLVDMGRDGNYNADISNEKTRSRFIGALNQELGLYSDVAAVYSPYYRQTTFPVLSLDIEEQEKYMQIAYDDGTSKSACMVGQPEPSSESGSPRLTNARYIIASSRVIFSYLRVFCCCMILTLCSHL